MRGLVSLHGGRARRRIRLAGVVSGAALLLGGLVLGLNLNSGPTPRVQGQLGSALPRVQEPLGSALPRLLSPSTGRTFYVSSAGSDSDPGTFKRPWRTIQKALDSLQAGQTALVLSGTYTENLRFSRAGTASAPITVAAKPGDKVVLHAATPSRDGVDWYPVQITGSYFRLHGFVIEDGRGTSDANVFLWDGANHIEVSGNYIRYGQDQGIFADETTSHLYLLANKIHDNGWNHLPGQHQSHAIYIEGSNDLIANNLIYNQPYGFGIQIYPTNRDTIVVNNTIVGTGHGSIAVGGSGGVHDITIRNNILYVSGATYGGDYGIYTTSTCPTGTVVDHNVIYAYRIAPIQPGCRTVYSIGENIFANPLFVDPTRDLQLQSTSPALKRASAAWSLPTDFAGAARTGDAAPTIGAFER